MSRLSTKARAHAISDWLARHTKLGRIPAAPLTIILAGVIGVLGGYGAILFLLIIDTVQKFTVERVLQAVATNWMWLGLLCLVPGLGLVAVAWFTRRFAPEAEGHGVPEVITAVARHDGVIRPRVSLVKIVASGFVSARGARSGGKAQSSRLDRRWAASLVSCSDSRRDISRCWWLPARQLGSVRRLTRRWPV